MAVKKILMLVGDFVEDYEAMAVRTVKVRSQVTGVIKKTLFAEGDLVQEGQPLLVIDPDGYKAKLDEAVSTLARDRSSAAQAKRDWLRYKDLVAQAVISQDDYEQKRTAFQQATEQVRVDQASVADAKVNLEYCYINAPCTGIAGLQSYKTGNLVEANKDIIVTVNQIQPINVQFAVAEKYLPEIRAHGHRLRHRGRKGRQVHLRRRVRRLRGAVSSHHGRG